MKGRNPVLGAIIAVVFIGFGSYRLYNHFVLEEELATWRLIMAVGFVVYGIVVAYNLMNRKNEEQ